VTETAGATELSLRVLEDFDAPGIDPRAWDGLLAQSPTDAPFLTHEWQRLWWRHFGDERLTIVLAEREGQLAAIAPLFAVEGSISLVGSGNSDFLDFIGRPDEAALAAMLAAARDVVEGFSAIELYHLPVDSPTTAMLPGVAARLGLELYREEAPGAPYALLDDAELFERLTARRSVRKEEARMARAGELRVRVADADDLPGLLDLFLAQHGERWRGAGEESFGRRGSREFLSAVVPAGQRGGWSRLTALEWRGEVAAIDISVIRGSSQLTWLVSRDPSIRDYSPGRVLGARVIGDARQAGIRRFDFGLGEEDYKLRSTSGVRALANWFLYP
jgi:CelD/BcsL family acetyltransferase involved in cellulose biosynthesis